MDISVETVRDLIEHFRLLDAKDGGGGAALDAFDDGGNVLADLAGDATGDVVAGVINGLDVDEQADLVALVWIGRGDFEPTEWPAAVRRAGERATRSTARYLLGIPNVGDLLEEGLAAMGIDDET